MSLLTAQLGKIPVSAGSDEPGDIANLLFWLKADSLALADGAAIDTWEDSGANNWDATAAGTERPTLQTNEINGNPVVRFDGTNDYMKITSLATGGVATLTVYAVVKMAVPGSQIIILQQFDPWYNQTGGWVINVKTTAKPEIGHFGNVGLSVNDGTIDLADGTPKVIRCLFDMSLATNEVAAWINGSSATGTYSFNSNNTTSGFGTNTLGIGGTPGGGQVLTGDIAEIAVWTRALTAGEVTSMDSYFTTKYGL